MDFSTRWCVEGSQDMAQLQTTSIIPVELNAYLYDMERNLASFAKELGDAPAAARFSAAAAARAAAIRSLMWNPDACKSFCLTASPKVW